MAEYCIEDERLIDKLSVDDLNNLYEDEDTYRYMYPINWALECAIEAEKVIKRLMRMGAKLNPKDQEPPLLFVQNDEDFNLLIRLGANPNHQYKTYDLDDSEKTITPIVQAAHFGNSFILDLLLKNGAKKDDKFASMAITQAILTEEEGLEKKKEILSVFIDNGVNIFQEKEDGIPNIFKTVKELPNEERVDLTNWLVGKYRAYVYAQIKDENAISMAIVRALSSQIQK